MSMVLFCFLAVLERDSINFRCASFSAFSIHLASASKSNSQTLRLLSACDLLVQYLHLSFSSQTAESPDALAGFLFLINIFSGIYRGGRGWGQ